MAQWEAHKCVIRGKLLKIEAIRKRNKQESIHTLLKQIQNLKEAHKLTRAPQTQTELDHARLT